MGEYAPLSPPNPHGGPAIPPLNKADTTASHGCTPGTPRAVKKYVRTTYLLTWWIIIRISNRHLWNVQQLVLEHEQEDSAGQTQRPDPCRAPR